jgi:hypothetical protein
MSPSRLNRVRALVAVAAVAVGVIVSPLVTRAALPTRLDVPYGGLILASFPCTATTYLGAPGLYILVLDFRYWVPIPTVLLPYSRLNMWYAPVVGNAGLGTFVPVPGVCTVSGEDYEPVAGFIPAWPLAGFGTSLRAPWKSFVPAALPV